MLDELVSKRSTSSGKGRVQQTRCVDILLHVCTHAQYTTAQVVNMLRQLGAEPLPATMLITLARNQMTL
ncbi:DinB family protein [Gimesia algae]|uniref:DinB family protein n=2 Tax=Gimesia algae TaxID=2527971 RepID=A0A517VBQ6_9PLAN|nr:DinB family protein [Gimesia algae]